MKKYKILEKRKGVYFSPFQSYKYGILNDFLSKEMVCTNFDSNPQRECSNGFYATDIDGLIYTNLSGNKVVFEVEMYGKQIISNTYKQRFEKQKFLRLIPLEEIKELVKKESEKMDWNYYDMLFPQNPLKIIPPKVTEEDKKLLKKWDSVWDSVENSVWSSVGSSVWALISQSFPNIKKWKYINHVEGDNPFQSCIDLWNKGLVPSFDGRTWRLHAGEDAKIVFEISKEKLHNL